MHIFNLLYFICVLRHFLHIIYYRLCENSILLFVISI